MGDPSEIGGSRHGLQATAEDLLSFCAGAPVSPAGDTAFEPLLDYSTLVGNLGAGNETTSEGPPAQLVKYIGRTGAVVAKRTPYVRGATVQYYLRKTKLISVRLRCTLRVGGKRARLSHVPALGEDIDLIPPALSASQLRSPCP